MDNSTLTITDCTERSGINGADVKIVNGSTANISGNHEGYGIHANDLLVEKSTLTANNNGYGGIRITGKGEFTNSTVTVTGTENKGNASVEITVNKNEHKDKDKYLVGSLDVRNSTLNISDNNATGIACRNRFSCPTSLTIDDASRVTIQNNNATPKNGYNPKGDSTGGGLRIEEGSTAVLGRNTVINNNTAKSGGGVYTKGGKVTVNSSTITENKATGNGGGIYGEQRSTIDLRTGALYNNHAGTAGDDIYLNNTTLILRPVGDDWILDDCGHPIDGWYLDGKDARWDADSQKKFVTNLDALLEGTDYMIEKGEDGCYIITIGSNALALKAAHNAPSEPKPDPDGPDTPNPKPNPKPEPKPGPDTSITPEDPQLPPVQDARADTPDSTVLPANPTNPAVQDAHALPQTGTSLFAALAMALSGFALTIAGAWASLLGKNSRH